MRVAELVLRVDPGWASINGRSKLRPKPVPRIVKSHEYAKALSAFSLQVKAWRMRHDEQRFETGALGMSVVVYWPRVRRLDTPTPFGDVDAPIKCLLDGLQGAGLAKPDRHWGLIDDDARIAELHVRKRFAGNKSKARFAVRIWTIEDPAF